MNREERLEGMLLGSFLGDMLALGTHWIYDQNRIEKILEASCEPINPLPDSYHPGKTIGDLTHYGDIAFFVFDFMVQCQSYDKTVFLDAFEAYMSTYTGYKDHATKATLDNLKQGRYEGSTSDELGGATRLIAPLFIFSDDPDTAIELSVAQCEATHQDGLLLEVTRYFAQVMLDILSGKAPIQSLQERQENKSEILKSLYELGKNTKQMDSKQAGIKLGQSCSVRHAFPLIIYLLSQNSLDFKEIMCKNVHIGGDSAARGMILGALLGAFYGVKQLPKSWIDKLNAYEQLEMRF